MGTTPTLGFLLHDVARLLRKRFEQRSRAARLTRSQWQVLAYLAGNEGIHQSALAELLDIEPITLVRLIDRMEARGLVERRHHATDRRVWLLFLQPEARPLLEIMRHTGHLTREEAFSGISPAERDRLLQTLSLIKSNLLDACGQPVEEQEAHHG
ncbi:DNA-binding transcriptional regulator, MarR family [Faunimonas pinastri]|uniref:DNA-binding transcriptional regulator, MarR family n=1 Tax=Faunimonas pinastri TaxID=1855383 RepID=A0A1H9PXB1_9HYPH|nr:MarR family transcriptional regulator [Faunimonas pinastri]SER52847.1 DNA-binding transcriptional regulator, MarR family [Faunimonas pinastri]